MGRFDHRPAVIDGDTALLPLGRDAKYGYTKVDKEYAYLDQYKWRIDSYGYVVAWNGTGKNKVNLRLHRVICNPSKGLSVDHINNDKLDNRSSNLREATQSQNMMNRKALKTNKAGFKGVSWHKSSNSYRVCISTNGKQKQIDGFKDVLTAAKRYNELASKYYGDYAKLNEIEGIVWVG